MKTFLTTKKLGQLYYDKVLFENYYPVLFTLKDDENNFFICVCHHKDNEKTNWLLTKVYPSEIISLLTNRITIRKLFLLHPEVRYSITQKSNDLIIEENVYSDWAEDSSVLPDDTYMDAEEGEYDDEIIYYASFDEDDIDVLFSTLTHKDKLEVKKQIIQIITQRSIAIAE